jgi:CheY-like chemotaxis protein
MRFTAKAYCRHILRENPWAGFRAESWISLVTVQVLGEMLPLSSIFISMSTHDSNGGEGFTAQILHLEDSRLDAEIVGYFLENGGVSAKITLVTDVESFRKALSDCAFDVILCDQNLPGWVGPKPYEMARQIQPTVPVIVLSGNLDNLDSLEPKVEGLVYVLKSELASLVTAVQHAIGQSRVAKGPAEVRRPAA